MHLICMLLFGVGEAEEGRGLDGVGGGIVWGFCGGGAYSNGGGEGV